MLFGGGRGGEELAADWQTKLPAPTVVLPVVFREVGERGLDDADGVVVLDFLVVVLDGDDHLATLGLDPAGADLQGLVDAGDGDGGLVGRVLDALPEGAVVVVQLDQHVDGDLGQAVATVVVDAGIAAGEQTVPSVVVLDEAAALVAERVGAEQLVHVGVGQQVAGCDLVEQCVVGVGVGLSGARLGRCAGGGSVVAGIVVGVVAVASGHEGHGCDRADTDESELSSVHGISR